MKFKGICWPHPELTLEVTTYELEAIRRALQAQLKKDADRRLTYEWLIRDIDTLLRKAEKRPQ